MKKVYDKNSVSIYKYSLFKDSLFKIETIKALQEFDHIYIAFEDVREIKEITKLISVLSPNSFSFIRMKSDKMSDKSISIEK
jgi:hypothetical protein